MLLCHRSIKSIHIRLRASYWCILCENALLELLSYLFFSSEDTATIVYGRPYIFGLQCSLGQRSLSKWVDDGDNGRIVASLEHGWELREFQVKFLLQITLHPSEKSERGGGRGRGEQVEEIGLEK